MATDCSISTRSSATNPHPPPSSATRGSRPSSSEKTSDGRLRTSASSTRERRSSRISGRGSTSSEKGLEPYWTEYSKDISSLLLSPTEIVSRGSDSNSSSTWSRPGVGRSWFSTELKVLRSRNSRVIFSRSSMCSPVECTDSAGTLLRSRKIRIYPNRDQKQLLRSWFGAARWFYNKTVELLKSGIRGNWMLMSKAIFRWAPEHQKSVPHAIKHLAVRDAHRAWRAGVKKVKSGVIPRFQMDFRSKKLGDNHFWAIGRVIKHNSVYSTLLGRIRSAESFPSTPKDSSITLEKGRWFLNTPVSVDRERGENQASIVALDPGVRTFMSIFGVVEDTEIHGHFGRGAARRLTRLCLQADRLISLLNGPPGGPRKCQLKRALNRIKWKIQDLRSELHNQLAKWLCSKFKVIILPTFESGQMVLRAKRKIRSKSARAMMTFGFYQFAQKLESKAEQFGVRVIRCSEAYTSKTNSWTGEIKNIGGAKFITSSGVRIDRDLNGARGILLRALGDTPEARDYVWTAETAGDTAHVNRR